MTNEEINYYINSRTLSILIGKKISELDLGQDILSSSYFLISQKSGNSYVSKKITYQNVLNQMAKDISAILGLCSMAFRDNWEYSKTNHKHDYNRVVCVPTYQISDFQNPSDISCICTVLTSNSNTSSVVSVLYPPMQKPQPQIPYIGEFRMYAAKNTKTSQQIRQDIQNGTFDGWVYTNGESFNKISNPYDFTDAFEYYNGRGTSFTVPKFENFLRMNGTDIPGKGYNKVQYNNYISVDHQHNFSTNGGDLVGRDVEVLLEIPGSSHGDNHGEKGLHLNYEGTSKTQITGITADIDITGLNATGSIQSSNDTFGRNMDIETYPKHYLLPGMVYIGNKKIGE